MLDVRTRTGSHAYGNYNSPALLSICRLRLTDWSYLILHGKRDRRGLCFFFFGNPHPYQFVSPLRLSKYRQFMENVHSSLVLSLFLLPHQSLKSTSSLTVGVFGLLQIHFADVRICSVQQQH